MTKYTIRARLYQDGGASGPRGTIQTDSDSRKVTIDALKTWSEGQIGWPWGGVLATVESDDHDGILDTIELSFVDGACEVLA